MRRWKKNTNPTPKNSNEVCSFLGLGSYYKHFIDHFTNEGHCLDDLISPVATEAKCWGTNKNVNHKIEKIKTR